MIKQWDIQHQDNRLTLVMAQHKEHQHPEQQGQHHVVRDGYTEGDEKIL